MNTVQTLVEAQGSSGLMQAWSDVDRSGTLTKEIEAAEEAWSGGVADFGNPNAASMITKMSSYAAYAAALRQSLMRRVGFPLLVYRSMPEQAFHDFIAGPYSTAWGTSVDVDTAKRFAQFAWKPKIPKVLVKITVKDPEAIIMRGKQEERELVINPWIVEDTDDMVVIKQLNFIASLEDDPDLNPEVAAAIQHFKEDKNSHSLRRFMNTVQTLVEARQNPI